MITIRPNRTRRKLNAGQHVFGVMLDVLHPDVVEMIGLLGFDFVLIDGEHFLYDQSLYQHLIRAADLYGMTSTIRLQTLAPDWVGRLLDMGIQGLVGTHITCAQDAEAMVRAAKLPPVGERGWGVFSRANRYALADETAAAQTSNDAVLLVAMVEDRLGVEHIDEILAVPGIDAISIGTSDMAQSYGVPGNLTHPEIRAAVTRVCDAVERSSKALSATAASRVMGLSQPDFSRRYKCARYHLASAGGILRSGLSAYMASWSEFQSVTEE